MSDKFRKDRAHIRYKLADGTVVPGATTITGLRAKPFLIKWANNLGLEGIDSDKYRDARADIGTCCHYLIECHVRGQEPDLSEYAPKVRDLAENGFLHWLSWEKQMGGFELVKSEYPLVSEMYGYGGMVDLYGVLNKRLSLIDIKTGPAIYPEMFTQVAAYSNLLEENGHEVEDIYIVRVGRGEDDDGFDYRQLSPPREAQHFQIFLNLLRVYQIEKELAKEPA